MAIKTGEYLNTKDIYINYSFEDVMFRRDHLSGEIYRKFYDEEECERPVPYDNRLYADPLLPATKYVTTINAVFNIEMRLMDKPHKEPAYNFR